MIATLLLAIEWCCCHGYCEQQRERWNCIADLVLAWGVTAWPPMMVCGLCWQLLYLCIRGFGSLWLLFFLLVLANLYLLFTLSFGTSCDRVLFNIIC